MTPSIVAAEEGEHGTDKGPGRASNVGAALHPSGPSHTLVAINGGSDTRWSSNGPFPDVTKTGKGTLLGPVTGQNP